MLQDENVKVYSQPSKAAHKLGAYQLLVSHYDGGPESLMAEHPSQEMVRRMVYSSTLAVQLRQEGFRFWRIGSTYPIDRRAI
jgi:hypothetical protein